MFICGNIVMRSIGIVIKVIRSVCYYLGFVIFGFYFLFLLSMVYCLRLMYYLIVRNIIIVRMSIIRVKVVICGLFMVNFEMKEL